MSDPLTSTEYERAMDSVKDQLPDEIGEAVSNCCGHDFYPESDLCRHCGEHASGSLYLHVGQRPDGEKSWAIVEIDVFTRKVTSLELES